MGRSRDRSSAGVLELSLSVPTPPLSTPPPAGSRALPILDERLRGTRFIELAPKSLLNSPEQTGMDFWSLNPYIGCEFGCTYCYARYAHRYVVERAHDGGRLGEEEYLDLGGPAGPGRSEAFERRVFVKQHITAVFERDLERYFRVARRNPQSDTIVIGTATDPYQPAERRFRVTRQVLERLAQCEGLSVGVITKSPLVARDIDLFRALAARNDLEVLVSLISVDAPLIRKVEARSPTPAARLRALRKLTAAGIHAGLIVAPVLPGITDDIPHLEALFHAGREAGARFVYVGPLRLYHGVRDCFLPVVARHFPELVARYERAYARHSAAPREYATALARRVKRLQGNFGYPINDGMKDRYRQRVPPPQGELELGR